MTSQAWLNSSTFIPTVPSAPHPSIWTHQLVVIVPSTINDTTAGNSKRTSALYITGGGNGDPFPTTGNPSEDVLLPAALRTVSGGQASSDDRASSSDNLRSVFFHSYVTYLAVLGAWELGATPQERWTSQSDASATAGLLICADNLMQLPVQFRKKVPLSKTWTVLAHHVAQTGVFLLALHTGRCHYWCAHP